MKIKLPKPVNRDPNFLDANSRKAAGPFRDKKRKRPQKVRLSDFDDELDDVLSAALNNLENIEWEEE